MCYNIASSSSHRESTLVFPGTRSHVSPYRLTSTTLPLCHCARVYHNIHNNMYALAVALNRQTVRLLRCVCFCLFTLLLYPRLYLPVCIQLNRTYEDRCCCCTFEHLQVLLIYDVQHSPLWLSRASSPVSLWAFLTFFFNSHEHLRVLLFVAFVVQYAKALNNL